MRRSPTASPDEGQIIPLVIGYVLVALLMVVVVIDVTSVQLQHGRLYALADAAALDASDELEPGDFYAVGADRTVVPVTDAGVRRAVTAYLALAPTRFTDVRLAAPTGRDDGAEGAQGVRVTLAATARLPLIDSVVGRWAGGVPLRATAHARSVTTAGT